MIRNLGLVLHQHRPEAVELAHRALQWAEGAKATVQLPTLDAELVARPDLGVDEVQFGEGLDLVLSLGGDGTMLRATNLVSGGEVPILGVNLGNLGYLTGFESSEMEAALDEWCRGELTVEQRMLLEVRLSRGGQGSGDVLGLAVNELVIERGEPGHTVSVQVSIAGKYFTHYLADGLIVATPTGSTAYSLSAGGPIIEPNFEALLMTPVAAHMVFNRSLVLAPATEIKLVVDGYRDGIVTLDGRRVAEVVPGDTLFCQAAQDRARFVVRGGRDFHTVLKEKFGLTER